MYSLDSMPRKNVFEFLQERAMTTADTKAAETLEDAILAVLSGDTAIFLEDCPKALIISSKKFPTRGVQSAESEVSVRGPKDSFTESMRANTVLIRRRIRDTRLKTLQTKVGVRSQTDITIMYMDGIARPELVADIQERLKRFKIDGIFDSGSLEQLTEKKWYSPFPQFQTTQRPDRAAMAVLEGRVIVMCDNSPIGLILPTDYNSFIRTSDDYYSRFEIATFGRILRYLASFFAMTLPGFYLAVTNFHTQILPTTLLLSFAEARQGVPFPAVVEVLIMELSFELLREAGVRLPGAMGNTIGIVGGLIIGQAAVEANLVSPIVVIVISFTALLFLCNTERRFATAFRILKFVFYCGRAWLGYFGMLLGRLRCSPICRI